MNLPTALSLYRTHCEENGIACLGPQQPVIERDDYWFFSDAEPVLGRIGLIIRKRDGFPTVLGSALGHDQEMVFWAYEKGLLTGKCDLVITGIPGDVDDVIDVLTKVPPSQRGMRIPGKARDKWRAAFASIPAVIFAEADLSFYVHELWNAQKAGTFLFEIRPRV